MPEAKPRLNITNQGDVQMVEFSDRKILDELTITQIGEQISEIVKAHPGVKLLLNFRNVEHLSSAALGMLIEKDKEIRQGQGRLKLCNIRPQILEVFKITKLNKLFEIHETAEAAIQSF